VAGSAALLVQLHPDWRPDQIKSALMSTANQQVWLDTAKLFPATVLDMGSGRIDLTKAGQPGLTFDHASISAGELPAGRGIDAALNATNVSGGADTWDVSVTTSDPALTIGVNPKVFTAKADQSFTVPVHVATKGAAAAQNYEGQVLLRSRATSRTLH